jgi:zinc protease
MKSILLLPEAFESERQVILEERKMRYENSPRGKLYLTMMQEVFDGTPYGGSVIGDIEDIEGLERDRMLEFHKTFYSPNNAVVVIVGDFDSKDAKTWLKKSFSDIEKNKTLQKLKDEYNAPKAYVTQTKFNREVQIHGQSKKPVFMVAYKGEKLGTHRSYVLDLLSSMLGGGESSHLNQLYVQTTRPNLSSISVGNYNLKYNGVFYINGELLDGVSLAGFRKRLLKDSLRFCEDGLSERALQKTKNQYLVGYYKELNTNAGLASFLGLRENFFGDYRYYQKELKTYSSIALDEVKETCRDVFSDKQQIFLSVWDKHAETKDEGEKNE